MMYLNLGQDDDAYNFIKFWLLETKKTRMKCPRQWKCFVEFGDQRPFDKMSLKGQDKKENLIKELDIDVSQAPCYLDSLFFIHLSIIKCNTMNGMSKDHRKEQESHLQVFIYLPNIYYISKKNVSSIKKRSMTHCNLRRLK